ncbi:zonular occludens toxin domain-containing protein [Stutzerimonas stutzeri]|uniref:zonular occludens toxin domain-containing protein n=1 Tax=Stutzerimonas stutzeri TaxID=316 RepID=UPI0009EA75EB|nr:zonular occludens toxin domain-containing protein [Stutzerimonas stutzeri]
MAVYIVTGKLGAGKTLLCIQKIMDYLKAGRPVAVNVDVRMNKLCRKSNKHSRLVRLPGLPTANDLLGLGFGSDVYDEEKFGGIFLDEAGVWLNSRDWNAKGRTDLLNFFLFLRKRRWDLWLCVQNVNVIDKQIRESIAEHVVYISRLDKLKLPFPFGLLLRIFTLGRFKGRLPKVHLATVKLGCKHLAPTVDTWAYRGEEFYSFYDTTQEYNQGYDKGSYSMLPPGYWRSPIPAAKRGLRFLMRMTKIFFRRTRFINSFFLGGVLSLVLSFVIFSGLVFVSSPAAVSGVQSVSSDSLHQLEKYRGYRVAFYSFVNGRHDYTFMDESGSRVTTNDLISLGVLVVPAGPRSAVLRRGDESLTLTR